MRHLLLLTLLVCGSLTWSAPLKTGDMAPDFSAKGSDGKPYKLSEFRGKLIVLEWFNKDCPYVHKFYDSKTMQDLQETAKKKDVIWFTIASSAEGKEGYLDSKTADKVRNEKGMANKALLLDSNGQIAKLYSAKTTPHMFVIDRAGKIAYQGAIDDHPSATQKSLEGAQNYVKAALESLSKPVPEPVKVASTAPYGCGVKY